ncbi:MAG TPA: tannase/feruloyl esterase family alpha/beta hydrolase [Oceanospirillales bacterium]|nr:tannase/feruloyl esterase family alpha/beta hydrolase [Oceanospirillales bacterium]
MKSALMACTLLLTSLDSIQASAASCSDLMQLNSDRVQITTAAAQPAQTLPPDPMSAMTGGSPTQVDVGAHCLVEGKIEDRDGVNGRYGIRFQMRLPEDWNGRFLFQGGGGTDGFIAPAIGAVPSTGTTATPALKRGYAVVSMDGGHNGMTMDFGADQQARLDLAYASIGKVTTVAKSLISTLYGKAADESFFMGCSNGGREAMMAAQRYPLEFDGIVAGNPGFHLTRAAIGAIWDVQKFSAIAPEGRLYDALTQKDLDTVSDAILAQCDSLDGIKDGVVAAYGLCDFKASSLKGKLAPEKIKALTAVMKGAHDNNGNAVYSTWPWDPGISSAGWRAWKLGTAEQPALNIILSKPSFGALFMTPPQAVSDTPDYTALVEGVAEVGGYFDADSTYVTSYAKRGGKMIIFQGVADPIFSADDITHWYEKTTRDTGPDVARLFMVPGMTHCGGGPAFEDFDPLALLENWRDTGKAPVSMPAKSHVFADRQMPLCAYPMYAEYQGGDKAALNSYQCVNP